MDYIENISLFRRQLPQASLQKIRQTILAASSQPCQRFHSSLPVTAARRWVHPTRTLAGLRDWGGEVGDGAGALEAEHGSGLIRSAR